MSLINYVEPIRIGDIFIGIGSLACSILVMWILYRVYLKFIQYIDTILNRAMKYEILEEAYLDKIGKKRGIDLNKELIKKEIIKNKSKVSLRKKISDEVFKEMFGKEEKEKEE